jgi:hypothetical protein
LSHELFTSSTLAFSGLLSKGDTASVPLLSASLVEDFFVDFGFHSLAGCMAAERRKMGHDLQSPPRTKE